jgi:hypothetical protein
VTLSRTQVDRLGDRLRKDDVPSDDDLRLLSAFREERRGAMDAVGAGLAALVGSVPPGRLKTINSIVDKLRRERSRLSTVQDIAGLRIVRDMTRIDQDVLVQHILARFPDCRVVDRRVKPSHGYRAVHVIAAVERHLVEIQVRTELQHRWAMLVEGLADAWGQQIKYGGSPDQPEVGGPAGRTRGALVGELEAVSSIIDGAEQSIDRGEPMAGVMDALFRYLERIAEAVPLAP